MTQVKSASTTTGDSGPQDYSPLGVQNDMLAAVYRSPGRLELERIQIPEIGPNELLVRIHACGFCGTDLKKIRYDLQPAPRIFGHEMAGVVARVGEGERSRRIGERVALFHHVPCGECFYCVRGFDAQCPQYKETVTTAGFTPSGGGFAQYVRVLPRGVARGTIPLPDNVSFEEAAFLEPITTCLKGIQRTRTVGGDSVLVFGLGPIGLTLAWLAARVGMRVAGIDPSSDRRERATELGVEALPDLGLAEVKKIVFGRTSSRGADAAIVATPAIEAIPVALDLIRPGGRVVLFASTRAPELAEIDVGNLCTLDKEIVGSYSSDLSQAAEALNILSRQEIPVRSLITHRFPMGEVNLALSTALRPPAGALKVMLNPQR